MGKGSGGGHTPWEQPESGRSKQRVKIVEVISEGEIKGLVDGVKSVFLDKTPVQNADDSYNFKNLQAHGVIGSQDQGVMRGFNTSEKEVSVGIAVKKTTPITRTINDEKVTRLRFTIGVKGLLQQKDNGDTVESTVDLVITVGGKSYPVNIKGKYSSQYLRQIIVSELPKTPFVVKVERITDDSKSQRLQNGTVWSSYTEIIDTAFAYPNTALTGIMFDSEYFSQLPQRNYEVLGIKVLVPTNYDPTTRTYSGLWDGTFKVAWTNNPAWIFYDLMTNNRYGMGQRLGEFGVDKWALYAIAQYCDQIVPDGFGGNEPRMTCNCWITEQRQAHDLIHDLASVFRSMPVWNGTQLTTVQDRPSDPVWTYTNANVEKGEFTRQYSALKARHNAIHVEYLDAANFYEKKIEYVSDDGLIKRYGLNVRKVTAFGCTSRGQAYRVGRWILETGKLEKETITFTVGREGLMHLPGDIIRISDNHYAGTDIGGRVVAVKGKVVALDREITIKGDSYLSFINTEAKHSTIKIHSVTGKNVTLESEPTGLSEYGVWSLSTAVITSGLYKAVSISEEDGKYTITALQHEPQKESIVDNGAHFEPREETLHNAKPAQPIHSDVAVTEDGITLTWQQPTVIGTVTYEIKLYKDGKLYRTYMDLKSPTMTFEGLPNGSYVAEIRAKNQLGQYSNAVTKAFDINLSITQLRTTPELMAIRLDWQLPTLAAVGSATEIWRSQTADLLSAVKIATLSYPQVNHTVTNIGLSEGWYFWVRLADKSGNKGEFTEGVFGEADHNPSNLTEYLHGQITHTELGQDLTAQLTGFENGIARANTEIAQESRDRATALLAESQARMTEVKKAANKAAVDLLAESQARGTQVTQLQKASQQQAQLISQVTAKVGEALTGIADEKNARIEGDTAEAKARKTLAAKVTLTEAAVNENKRSVATLNEATAQGFVNLSSKINHNSAQITTLTTTKAGRDEVVSIAHSGLQAEWKKDVAGAKAIANTAKAAADNAKRAADQAKEDATAKSNAAKAAAIAAARGDATTKANAAKAAAIADAAAKDAAVKTAAATDAQTKANAAKAAAIAEARKLDNTTNSKIDSLARTVSDGTVATSTKLDKLTSEFNTIGVTNLLVDSTYKKFRIWKNNAIVTEHTYLSNRLLKVSKKITSSAQFGVYQAVVSAKTRIVQGTVYTLSMFIKGTSQLERLGVNYLWLMREDGRNHKLSKLSLNNSFSVKRSQTFTAPWTSNAVSILIAFEGQISSDQWFEFHSVKLERGTVATDWTPAPEDLESDISLVNDNLTNQNRIITRAVSDIANLQSTINDAKGSSATLSQSLSSRFTTTLESSKADATAKSNAAKAAAIAEARKLDATAKAQITALQNTVANTNKAQAEETKQLKALVGTHTANITSASKAVADLAGKVNATHTLKVQSIARGRKAIAGIALGTTANNKTAESSVIVMADKFGVVKNANDGNVVPMFSVVNNKVAVNGDLIASGSILGTHIRAGQTLSSPVINGGRASFGGGKLNIYADGSLNSNNGNFLVDPNGHVTAKSGIFKGRIEATSGYFKGDLEVRQIIGGNLLEVSSSIAKVIKSRSKSYGDSNHQITIRFEKCRTNITIDARPFDRVIQILCSVSDLGRKEFRYGVSMGSGDNDSTDWRSTWEPYVTGQVTLQIHRNTTNYTHTNYPRMFILPANQQSMFKLEYERLLDIDISPLVTVIAMVKSNIAPSIHQS